MHPYSTGPRPGGRNRNRQKFNVGIIVLDNFTLHAFSSFVEALRLAADVGGRSRQVECGWSILGQGTVRASCGVTVVPEPLPDNPDCFDYLAVAGGNNFPQRRQPDSLTQYLQEADKAGVTLIGLCTGTFNIARAGLMTGRTACVHWNVSDEFRDQFPHISLRSDQLFIDSGDRITCAGSTGGADLALHLITRHCGPEKAQQSLRHMVRDRRRDASFPQTQFSADLQNISDNHLIRCVNLMEQTLNAPVSMGELSYRTGMSERQLSRRFIAALGMPPMTYYRHLRLRYCAWRLVHTTDHISWIANDAGFADSSHFSREFKRKHGMSPAIYRRTHLEDAGNGQIDGLLGPA